MIRFERRMKKTTEENAIRWTVLLDTSVSVGGGPGRVRKRKDEGSLRRELDH